MCSLGCSGPHSIDQGRLRLRDLPASASQGLGLKVSTTTTWLMQFVKFRNSCLDKMTSWNKVLTLIPNA